jgi:hypothetical protein
MKKLILAASLVWAGVAGAHEAAANAGGGKMVHCPSAVAGAKVEVKETADAVEVTVTGKGKAEEEIRARAKHMVDAAKNDPTSVAHTGDGHGGGGLGRCVVVLKDTTITAEDVPGGSKLTVKPVKAVDLEWLKKETAARKGGGAAKKK